MKIIITFIDYSIMIIIIMIMIRESQKARKILLWNSHIEFHEIIAVINNNDHQFWFFFSHGRILFEPNKNNWWTWNMILFLFLCVWCDNLLIKWNLTFTNQKDDDQYSFIFGLRNNKGKNTENLFSGK